MENLNHIDLSSISLLYQYTNPPPLAYGSPAPKVAESILRSQEYNKLPNNGRSDNQAEDRQYWRKADGDFPSNIQDPTSNINLAAMKKFSIEFLSRNYRAIDEVVDSVVNEIHNENADVLTKGRQTWDPFLQRSVTSADAYKEMANFFKKNTGKCNFTMIEWIHTWSELFEKDSIKLNEKTINKVKIEKITKQGFIKEKEKTIIKVKEREMNGEEARIFLLDMATEFCSYLKSKERSKLKRRAIASANMILRMFFEIIERFHLKLGKKIAGSTISQGGIEKQDKIMSSLSLLARKNYSVLATEDATKWNECLAPAGFYVMHEVFLNPKYRAAAKVTMSSEVDPSSFEMLREILHTGIYLLSKKRVFIGQGHVLEDGEAFTRERWYGIEKN
uniref:RNA-directed RNA polymerase catalytic subunit n=1 Tax=Shayang Spider Virus 3 TaxID=1608070 RepID=A0A0B5KTC0_9ORTO|nr:PB1 [Shayang Spider Virus 3]